MQSEPDHEYGPLPELCPGCGGEIAPGLLACPSCRRLVHGDTLKERAAQAEDAQSRGDLQAALGHWRMVLALLPSESRQYTIVSERIAQVGRQIDQSPRPSAANPEENDHWGGISSAGKYGGITGAILLGCWKFKFLGLLVLGKAKFLLLGLTKASTFLSMFAWIGAYFRLFGLWFALGLVLSIYIHEMGHMAALLRYGITPNAPMFVPGFGAFVRYGQRLEDPRQEARVSLAGPLWGLFTALGCFGIYTATNSPIWGGLANFGAMLNLFNLIPIGWLDGGRVFQGLTRPHRWLAMAGVATAWALSANPLLLLLMAGGAWRAATEKSQPARRDREMLAGYVLVVAALTGIMALPLPRI